MLVRSDTFHAAIESTLMHHSQEELRILMLAFPYHLQATKSSLHLPSLGTKLALTEKDLPQGFSSSPAGWRDHS